MARDNAPPPEPTKAPLSKGALAACIAAACLVAAPLAQKWEGYRGKAYLDPAHILTQCYGETEGVDPSRIYSKDECAAKLRARLARDYAPKIAACLPEIVGNRYIFGALLDASYNAGPVAVCNSRMAKAIKAGDLKAGCDLSGWYVTARNRKTGQRIMLPGLASRRNDEKAVCLRGAS